MDMQKMASDAFILFRITYNSPQAVEKTFRSTINKMVPCLYTDGCCEEQMEERRMQFAKEVWQHMHYMSLEVIRSRISNGDAWKDVAVGDRISQKIEELYLKKLMVELMGVLIKINYNERTSELRSSRKGI